MFPALLFLSCLLENLAKWSAFMSYFRSQVHIELEFAPNFPGVQLRVNLSGARGFFVFK